MRAIVCDGLHSIEDDGFQIVNVPEPIPRSHEVLIDVDVVGLTFLDVLIATGMYQVKFQAPFILGGEFAGRVASVGAEVSGFAKGDAVAGQTIVVTTCDPVLHV